MGSREKKPMKVGRPGAEDLEPGDGLLIIGKDGGTFRLWSDAKESFFSTKTVLLGHCTPLIVVEGDPMTIGVVAVDPLGRRVIVTHVDIIVGVVAALSRGGKQTTEEIACQ